MELTHFIIYIPIDVVIVWEQIVEGDNAKRYSRWQHYVHVHEIFEYIRLLSIQKIIIAPNRPNNQKTQ